MLSRRDLLRAAIGALLATTLAACQAAIRSLVPSSSPVAREGRIEEARIDASVARLDRLRAPG